MSKDVKSIDFKCIMVASTTNSTLSRLWMQQQRSTGIEAKGLCWILEDGERDVKVDGETRIPGGMKFRVRPTRNSKFYAPYKADKVLRAKYVLTLEDVPGFSLIRVHAGFDVGDTRGCTLPGLASGMDANSNFTVSRSKEALKRLYNICDPFFNEQKMDFEIPIFWEPIRTSLLSLANAYHSEQ
jgi:hypothetical protein